MRLLLSAFSCHPHLPSESAVGWGLANALAETHDVVVMTESSNRLLLERESTACKFVYVSSPLRFRRGPYASYIAWQYAAYHVGRRLLNTHDFDVVHHVTWVNDWLPCPMAKLSAPFVWNAGINHLTPLWLMKTLTSSARRGEYLRNAAVAGSHTLIRPDVLERARAVISVSPPEQWPQRYRAKVHEVAMGALSRVDVERLQKVRPRGRGPVRVASVGRLVGWKGLNIGLSAFARFAREVADAEFWIVGDGPEYPHLALLSRQLGCADRVRFIPWLRRDDLLELYSEIDILLHPSIHETYGFVVHEAMAAGKPVVAFNIGGPRLIIQSGAGMLVDLSDEVDLPRSLSEALLLILNHYKAASELAKKAAREQTWDRVAGRISALYEAITDHA